MSKSSKKKKVRCLLTFQNKPHRAKGETNLEQSKHDESSGEEETDLDDHDDDQWSHRISSGGSSCSTPCQIRSSMVGALWFPVLGSVEAMFAANSSSMAARPPLMMAAAAMSSMLPTGTGLSDSARLVVYILIVVLHHNLRYFLWRPANGHGPYLTIMSLTLLPFNWLLLFRSVLLSLVEDFTGSMQSSIAFLLWMLLFFDNLSSIFPQN